MNVETVPTVKVKADDVDGGYMIINKSDFDKDVHELYVEKKSRATGAPATVSGELPAGFALKNHPGGKFKLLKGDVALVYAEGHAKAGKDVIFASKDEAIAAAAELAAGE